jgi:hypothetical protein
MAGNNRISIPDFAFIQSEAPLPKDFGLCRFQEIGELFLGLSKTTPSMQIASIIIKD